MPSGINTPVKVLGFQYYISLVKTEYGCEARVSSWYKRFVCVLTGGDQSPESSAEWTPGRSPEPAAVGSVCLQRPRVAACHHYFLDHYLFFCFLVHVTALRVAPGLPRRRNGPQRRDLVAAGDQPAVDRSHASGGRGGTLEANVSGDDNENLIM